eukprot:TRINITY_DN75710_c0_g1_i1.p1 TRINITY_DN75710_c0_g1~~TRINITY_DN75710_c0_g1_i1.p1  ORF type:complete len:234 (-),score=49.14 TRINITY_DN75710_c0_g1_i1:280-909(-)
MSPPTSLRHSSLALQLACLSLTCWTPQSPLRLASAGVVADILDIGDQKQDQCHHDQDVDVWKKEGGKQHFASILDSCGSDCWGRSACVTKCVLREYNYTEGCAQCFGKLAWCTLKHCMFVCEAGRNEACAACNERRCLPGFLKCSGIPKTEIHGGALDMRKMGGSMGGMSGGMPGRRLPAAAGNPGTLSAVDDSSSSGGSSSTSSALLV